MNINSENVQEFIDKWKEILILQNWDIKYLFIEKEWRKTGDIKVDEDDRTAVLLLNTYNPKQTNLEEMIIHELLHLKLWEIDQLIVRLSDIVFKDDCDAIKDFFFTQFMSILEPTVNDLSKSFLRLGGIDKNISFGRLEVAIKEEFGEFNEVYFGENNML